MKIPAIPVNKLIILATLVVGISLSSCKQDDPIIAPTLPPVGSLNTDFSDFDTRGQKGVANWFHSAANVTFWNGVLSLTMKIPVAAFNEAFNHEPVQQETNKWMWTYTFGVNQEFNAKLYATVNSGQANWEMHISKTGDYNDFLWYTGTSSLDGKGGSWTLNKSPETPESFVGIEWSINDENFFTIQYTNISPEDTENGAYISYSTMNSNGYDVCYKVFNKGKDNLTNIEYNRTNKNGHVSDFLKYGDNDWHCWGNDLQDIDCE